ncbi:MAG: hypothetical protein WCB68_11720 [Pyrinomonadaceae bacterium]
MRNKLSLLVGAIALTLSAASLSLGQDIKITSRMSMNGQTMSESTTYIKGTRKRTESKMAMQQGMDASVAAMMPSVATVYQCDRRRMLQINDKARKYTVTMLEDVSASSAANDAAEMSSSGPSDARQGGLVTYTMSIVDTGQRQEMFGFKARYLKISATVDPSPGACAPKSHFEQEGWFIDFQADLSCSTNSVAEVGNRRPLRQGCQDRYRYRYTGGGKMGYPLSVTTVYYDEQGKPMAMKQEVVDLQRAPQDPALFDVPTGYTQASSAQELYAVNQSEMMAAMNNRRDRNNDTGSTSSNGAMNAKRPGVLRVGVVAINNKTDRSVSLDSLRGQLTDALNGSNLDAVALNATSTSDIEAEARQKQCDFILYTDIAALKQASASKKIGGMFGRATGVGSGGIDKTEARIDYRLIPVGSSSPQIQSSASAKEEGDEQSAGAAIQQEAQNIRSKIKK